MQSMQFMQIMKFGFELCEVYAVSAVCSLELMQSMLFGFVVKFWFKTAKTEVQFMQCYAILCRHAVYANNDV